MIYHLSFPHHPFLERFIEPFEDRFPGKNQVLLITNPSNERNKCFIPDNLLKYKGSSKDEIIEIINRDNNAGVCLYWLNDDLLDITKRIDKNIKIYFRSYGSDINRLIYKSSKKFYKPETRKIQEPNLIKTALRQVLSPVYHPIKQRLKKHVENSEYIPFFQRINAIGTVTRNEFDLLQNKVPNLTNNYILTAVYNKIDQTTNHFPKRIDRKIQLGHSSFAINNHADVLKLLSKYRHIGDLKIIVPLSYGDLQYGKKIISLGKKLFNEQFFPITEYLFLGKYNQLIDSCETFILNSYIQQGGGNVYHFLLNGGKVYMDEKNPIFIDAKKVGFIIFSIQKDLTEDHLYDYHLKLEEKIINRNMTLKHVYDKELIYTRTQQICELLCPQIQ